MSTPMTLGDKARAIGRLFDEGRTKDAYWALELMLKQNGWPAWLREDVARLNLDEKPKPSGSAGL